MSSSEDIETYKKIAGENGKYLGERAQSEQLLAEKDVYKRQGVMKSENGKIFAWKIRAVYAGMVCFAILLISYRPHEDFRIACLDVGQGDGIVVEIENRWNILIDGGSTDVYKRQVVQWIFFICL